MSCPTGAADSGSTGKAKLGGSRAAARSYLADSADTLVNAVLLLFLLQSLMALITSVYAFGLAASGLPLEALGALFVLSPVLLRLLSERFWMQARPVLVLLGCGGRVAYPLLPPGLAIVAAGLSFGALLLAVVLLITDGRERFVASLPGSLSVALAGLVTIRILGFGTDVSTYGPGQSVAWLMAAGTVAAFWARPRQLERFHPHVSETGSTLAASIGFMSCLVLMLSLYSALNVVQRWSDVSYQVSAVCFFAGLILYVLFHTYAESYLRDVRVLLVVQVGFAVCLLLTVLPQQVRLPFDSDTYPFLARHRSEWQTLPAFGVLALAPLVIHSAVQHARRIACLRTSMSGLAVGFTAGALVLVVLIGAQVLTTTYDYVPIIGPVMRDRFWLVVVVTSLIPAATSLTLRTGVPDAGPRPRSMIVPLGGIALVAFAGIVIGGRPPSASPGRVSSLNLVTYNIQQGFAEDGGFGLPQQLDVLRALRPDILGLQESDTNRLTSGNIDAVRYFADELGMYAYYGASPVAGTFGIALLSKYPIEDAKTFFLWSKGEQTGCVTARIKVNDQDFDVLVTHLGNGGPQVQLEQVLELAEHSEHVLLLGDFNFRPSTGQYQLATSRLADTWLASWPSGLNDAGQGRASVIDYIFVSKGMSVKTARFEVGAASDHPAYEVVIEP